MRWNEDLPGTLNTDDRMGTAEQLLENSEGDDAAFAYAFQAVMDELEVPSICVQSSDGSRVWNMVQVEGEWLHVDVAADAKNYELAQEDKGASQESLSAYCLIPSSKLPANSEKEGSGLQFDVVEGFELPESSGAEDGASQNADSSDVDDAIDQIDPLPSDDSGVAFDEDDESKPSSLDNGEDVSATNGVSQGSLNEQLDNIATYDESEVDSLSLGGDLSVGNARGSLKARASSYTLPYSSTNINSVGKQKGAGSAHQYCCGKYACAYGDTMLLGKAQSHHTTYTAKGYSDNSGYCGWQYWSKKSTGGLKIIYDEINAGKPAILHVRGVGGYASSTTHYVLVIGYKNVTNPNTITVDNLIAIDPWDSQVITVSSRYVRNATNQIQMSTRGISLTAHAHSFSVASKVYYHSTTHTVYYNKCSCGASKADTQEKHDFQWCGLVNKCTQCGAVFDGHTSTGEYFTNKQTVLYQGPGYRQTAIKTIPANTVIRPLEQPRAYEHGRNQLKITYGGVTGFIWASDATPNATGGIHKWKNGKCTQCGMWQPPTALGLYTVTANKTVYKDNALRGTKKALKPGDTILVTKTQVTTSGYLWGWDDQGYTFEMNPNDMKLKTQAFRHGSVTSIPNGVYYIHAAANTNYNVDVYGGYTTDRTNIQLYQDNSSKAQQFEFTKNSDGTYRIKSMISGKVLDAQGAGMTSGTNVFQYTYNGTANQHWYLERTSIGTYALRNKNSNLYLDISGGSVQNGGNIQQWQGTTTLNQQFFVEPVSKNSLAQQANDGFLIVGINSQYTYSGKAISPNPTVRKRVWAANSLRVPVSGIPGASDNWIHRKDTVNLKAGRTYILEVGAVSRDAGSGSAVVARAYNSNTDKSVAPDMVFSYGSKTQYREFTPTENCTLIFYSGRFGSTGGNVSTWKNVRVWETLKPNQDYKVSYKNNVKVGTATATVSGMGNYSGSRSVNYSIKAKPAPAKPKPTPANNGWVNSNGRWYYYQSGKLVKGWKQVSGVWYYLNPSDGAMATGWLNLGGTWYYLNGSGAMATGWCWVGNAWYYLYNSGAMATGWVKVGAYWYYMHNSGAMAANCWIGNYYVTGSGAMATNQWIGRYHVNGSGLWDRTR